MIIIVKNGNIFDAKTEMIVNPVNCQGVSGKGLALEFKHKFPLNQECYTHACDRKSLMAGGLLIYKEDNFLIANFATKKYWKEKSEYTYISIGLNILSSFIQKENIKSISIPKIGCGLGGLNWLTVKEMIISILGDINCEIHLYE